LADNVIFTHPDGMSPMQNMFLTDINNFHNQPKQMPAVGLHYCVIIHETPVQRANSVGRKNASFTHLDGMSPMQNMFLEDINNFHTTQQMRPVRLQ